MTSFRDGLISIIRTWQKHLPDKAPLLLQSGKTNIWIHGKKKDKKGICILTHDDQQGKLTEGEKKSRSYALSIRNC